MDKKSKVLFFVLFFAVLTAVGLSFYKYVIKMDYYLKIQVDCNPAKERCFTAEEETYYKIIMKKAYLIPDCDPEDAQCPSINCENDEICQEVFCDEGNVSAGETCNDPTAYQTDAV